MSSRQVEVTTPAATFLDETQFREHISRSIEQTDSFCELVYTEVPEYWGMNAVDFLNQTETWENRTSRKSFNSVTGVLCIRLMPEEIHDCHLKWWHDELVQLLTSGTLSPTEAELLWPGVGTTVEFVSGRYNNSRKEPDFFLRADDDDLPRFIIESGWSESWNRLLDDMKLCLLGGNGKVRTVLLLKWAKVGASNVVRGWLELYGLDAQGMPTRIQTETIFPEPPQGTQQQITLPRRVLFGPHILQGQDPNSEISLSIRSLRRIATRALRFMGLVPD